MERKRDNEMNSYMESLLSRLSGHSVLITGSTGLIGKAIVRCLMDWNINNPDRTIDIIAHIRNKKKADALFGGQSENLHYLVCDIQDINVEGLKINYVIHTASFTSSEKFISEPLEVIAAAVDGTRQLLNGLIGHDELLKVVYLSTMEVYGAPADDEKIDEKHGTNLDTMSVRSCYPTAKRMCENICTCYSAEHNIPTSVIRLTQTFGPGTAYSDGRVFAQFARCAIEGKNIVLMTKGQTKRSYLYVEDAVSAILTVLAFGSSGEAYNAANEKTYCSIYDMAKLVADGICDGKISVVIEETDCPQYAPTLCMNLNTSKLQLLGWKPMTDLKDMFKLMIDDMKTQR